jgi:hypothetical protein
MRRIVAYRKVAVPSMSRVPLGANTSITLVFSLLKACAMPLPRSRSLGCQTGGRQRSSLAALARDSLDAA